MKCHEFCLIQSANENVADGSYSVGPVNGSQHGGKRVHFCTGCQLPTLAFVFGGVVLLWITAVSDVMPM